ncbi:hypothetical protein ACFVR1_10445 [Psychrobacillus sp. NPDC058041]|uniref:hypothetical protein n=1 Tax=Psychrobacillus sp. NPDC058041 TaxID=3346310 RepID=UPI0036D8DC97
MKNKKTVGILILLLFAILFIILQFTKTIEAKDLLTEEFFSDKTHIIVERIIDVNFEEINLSENHEKELVSLLENAELKEVKEQNRPTPLDAEYRIVSKEDQIYIFVEENVIVFPKRNSKAYKVINNNNFIEEIEEILK